MRDILFRGKRSNNGEWVDGCLFIDDKGEKHEILVGYVNYRVAWEVVPETVGQYTGLKDKNGAKIFEGDIVIARVTGGAYKGFEWPCADVQYQKTSFGININKDFTPLASFAPTVEFEIIGNKHDDAEQLEV